MQRDGRYNSPYDPYGMGGYPFDPNAGASYGYGYGYGTPAPSAFEHHEFPRPLNQVEFQPSETCPKNFVIFDQTYSKSRVMFHPSLAQTFGSSRFDNMYENYTNHDVGGKSAYRDNGEDTEDIDALLSSEEAECQDDDDVVSTGRTPVSWGGSSPDSDGTKSNKWEAASAAGKKVSMTSGDSANSQRKRERMKKMVKTLKGIVPGGDRMDTPAVLDEAVRYLKSLKVEVKKLGMRKSDS